MKKLCIRKHYPLVNVVSLAISGATITRESDLDQLRMRELSAIECFAKGVAGPHDFRDIADMLNLSETMAEQGIEPEAKEAVQTAQSALLAAKARFDAGGSLTLTAAGLTALRALYGWHDAQRTAIDRRTYEAAIAKTRNRIRSAHPSVRVLT